MQKSVINVALLLFFGEYGVCTHFQYLNWFLAAWIEEAFKSLLNS